MWDIKLIRENPEELDKSQQKRGQPAISKDILALDARHRGVLQKMQDVQAERNALSKEIGRIKSQGGNADEVMAKVAALKSDEQRLEAEEKELAEKMRMALSVIPNRLDDSVPAGKDESQNQEVRRVGEPRKFNFEPKLHEEIGEKLEQMDFERAAKVSGSRFVFLRGPLARLERALAQFMLDVHTREFAYEEFVPPYLVNDATLYGTGQLPKFAGDQFKTEQGHWLIPTAEVVLTNFYADEIIDEKILPVRMTAYTPCFRSEAGAAGKDTRGMIRQHQFSKVELVSITRPDESWAEHERMTSCAEEILKRLELPYRVITLCSGDTGFGAMKTYDLEVWLPGQNAYREISSCSNCGDFQARRMKTRFRKDGEKNTTFVHTLNGSGVAVGRCMIAVLENYQEADGSVRVPSVLVPYMGTDVIQPLSG